MNISGTCSSCNSRIIPYRRSQQCSAPSRQHPWTRLLPLNRGHRWRDRRDARTVNAPDQHAGEERTMRTHPTQERLMALGLIGMAKALDDQRRQPTCSPSGLPPSARFDDTPLLTRSRSGFEVRPSPPARSLCRHSRRPCRTFSPLPPPFKINAAPDDDNSATRGDLVVTKSGATKLRPA